MLTEPAARTVMPITLMRAKLVLAGKSKDEVKESIPAAFKKGATGYGFFSAGLISKS
jgi:hypothetical protein